VIAKKLTIIIPAFSGREQIRKCLQSLSISSYQDLDVVIVDHGISDEISIMVNREFPNVTCLRASPDLWWSGATNIGIKHAIKEGSTLVMLLNHDCYTHIDTIEKLLLATFEKPDLIVAPVQHNPRTHKNTLGIWTCFLLGFTTVTPPAFIYKIMHKSGLIPTGLVLGGRGVVIHTSTFKKVGLLDEEHFPHYCADHDFFMRCKKSGIKLFIHADAIVDIDDTKTSSAEGSLSFGEFVSSLKNRNSHRNLKDVHTLMSRYYPIPGLAAIGVALNLLRFLLVNSTKRLLALKY
jgi:GT2 family glycosyltransferase